MRAFLAGGLAIGFALGAGLIAAEKKALESGPRIGAAVGAFQVLDVTGPNKGKSLCYR